MAWLQVNWTVKADRYCDRNGNNCTLGKTRTFLVNVTWWSWWWYNSFTNAKNSCMYTATAYPTWRVDPGSYDHCETKMRRTQYNWSTVQVATNCDYNSDWAKILVLEQCG